MSVLLRSVNTFESRLPSVVFGEHTMSISANVQGVVLDLDGLIIDTEVICSEVASVILRKYGKQLTEIARKNALGKRPLDCWTGIGKDLGIDVDPQQLLDESQPLVLERLPSAKLLPGALRLVRHLASSGVPYAIATSTPRSTFNRKMEEKEELRELLNVVVCGDEVPRGKPHPDVFEAACRKLGLPPRACVALEDAPSGVEAAKAAGLQVVFVPSTPAASAPSDEGVPPPPEQQQAQQEKAAAEGVADLEIKSLLDFKPEQFGLPPFADIVAEEVIPMLDQPIRIRGTVVKGFGRGSKELGVPTANVDPAALGRCLAEAVSGVYCGWASLGDSEEVYKMVMSIGWNPFFGNRHKTAEPWILHDFPTSFYGCEIRLLVVGYLRPEANFESLEALIQRIHRDADVSRRALDSQDLAVLQNDPFLKPDSTA